MFSLEIDCDPDDRPFLIAELWEQGSAGIAELDDRRVRAFFEDTASYDHLLGLFPGARFRVEEERDWVAAARELLQPMEVGARFFLVPEWRDDPAPPGRLRITINPGRAFGTGVHETTQLCLEALEECVRPGMSVLDVGAGQGVLARAARLLGAARVFACDVDPVAVEIAARAPEPAGSLFVGSVDAVSSGALDLVVANINPETIVRLAPDLMRVLRPEGVLVTSGFELDELDFVKSALPPADALRIRGNWAMIRT
jgi:ribosomal protein L11 methyltransferase